MNSQHLVNTSRFLSLILRHKPETIGVKLDDAGWVNVETLLEHLALHGKQLSIAELQEIVATNSKQRFAFNEDKTSIRANQGHSLDVALQLDAVVPPEQLYHGTAEKSLIIIMQDGLSKMNRHHVHLTTSIDTAKQVGSRYGKPVILTIDSRQMHSDGLVFYRSENGVWLTDSVPPKYIKSNKEG